MKLRVRVLGLDAAGKTIAIINDEDARELGVHPIERIVLKKGSKKLTVVVNTTKKFVKEGNIVVYKEVSELLRLKTGDTLEAEPRETLASKYYIRKKIDGGELAANEIRCIVDDVLARNLNDLELAAFITALYIHGLTMNEAAALSRAMVGTSKKIAFHGTVVDKHSIGGVSGDKTSLLLVPIIAAAGLTIPKTSSRSITSPAGTADRMEILAPVELDIKSIKRVVKKAGGCLVWGGAVDLAPADDLFIQIEHPLSLDPLLLPSVMSKKKVAGSKYVVIDIPVGLEAKMKSREEAEKLAKKFILLGKDLGIKVDCGITNGNQPIGYAIGPALEAKEALETIMGIKQPADLVDKVTSLSGLLLSMCGKGNVATAKKILNSGMAEKKLRQIIGAQGGNPKIMPDDIPFADYKISIKSDSGGIVTGISDDKIAYVARVAGAPKDKLAGIMLNKKIGDRVKKGDVLFTIFAEKKQKLSKAYKAARSMHIFYILDHKERKMLIERV